MKEDIDLLVDAWINHWEVYEKTKQFPPDPDGIDLWDIQEAPADFRLRFVLGVLNRIPADADNHLMQVLAAGDLEDLLVDHGPAVIDKIESLAHESPAFNLLLGGVWGRRMAPQIWARVQAYRNEVW